MYKVGKSELQTGDGDGCHWFHVDPVYDWLYLIREVHFYEGNRCNIWLIKGPTHDVLIDTGLGVCDLNEFLHTLRLIRVDNRPCIVICTHCHFDHVGGAHHFNSATAGGSISDTSEVYVHERDAAAVEAGRQTSTLNYVKPDHFHCEPYPAFSARNYCVPPTPCRRLRSDDAIEIGPRAEDRLQVIHVPGHTAGSIAVFYAARRALFSGDFVYECSDGSTLMDWLPTSDVGDYMRSADFMIAMLEREPDITLFPGHFSRLSAPRAVELLSEYRSSRMSCGSRSAAGCMQCVSGMFFLCGCFRCCPC